MFPVTLPVFPITILSAVSCTSATPSMLTSLALDISPFNTTLLPTSYPVELDFGLLLTELDLVVLDFGI